MSSPYIFGIHEPGGERYMVDAGRPGWIVFTEKVSTGGKDFTTWADQNLGIICRLNHGYEPDGTIPHSSLYEAFAQSVAHYVAASHGCKIWQLGNEMNAQWERPGGKEGEVITPQRYTHCYRLCSDAIHALPGHADDQVLIGAVAPWNNQTTYPGNESGDWIQYFRDLLGFIDGACTGIAIHAYTHGHNPDLIHSDAKMGAPFDRYHYHFRCYQDFMNAIPVNMRHLPVYLTEMDADDPWQNTNNGWVQRAYGDINWWNQNRGHQQIRAACLYRWPQIDRWYIEGKAGVIEDFKDALHNEYRWQQPQPVTVRTAYVNTPAGLNLRASASPHGAVLDILKMGTEVNVLGEPKGDWASVAAGGQHGYVSALFLSDEAPTQAPSQPQVLIDELAAAHGLDVRLVKAVIQIESGGTGFMNGRLLIRFEPHIFMAYLTGTDWDKAAARFQVGSPRWDGGQHRLWDGGWKGFHGNQDLEWKALDMAREINTDLAVKSISMGAPQIMGFHHGLLGYPSPQAMMDDFQKNEEVQYRAMFTFMERKGATKALREGDLVGFAAIYNGIGQAAHYAALIERAME